MTGNRRAWHGLFAPDQTPSHPVTNLGGWRACVPLEAEDPVDERVHMARRVLEQLGALARHEADPTGFTQAIERADQVGRPGMLGPVVVLAGETRAHDHATIASLLAGHSRVRWCGSAVAQPCELEESLRSLGSPLGPGMDNDTSPPSLRPARGRRQVAAALLCAIVAAGCSVTDRLSGSGNDAQAVDRSDTYVTQCWNGTINSFDKYLGAYLELVDAEGVPADPAAVVGLNPPDRRGSCDEAIAAAAGSTDSVDLAALAFGAELDRLAPVVDEIVRYYGRGDFVDDAFAAGRELHSDLAMLLDPYAAARDPFLAALEAVGEANDAELLDAAADADADLVTLLGAAMALAEESLNELADEGGGVLRTADFASIDTAAFGASVDGFVAAWDRARARAEATTEDEQLVAYPQFSGQMETLVAELRDLQRRLATTEPFTAAELAEAESFPLTALVGLEHLLGTYNSTVNSFNLL